MFCDGAVLHDLTAYYRVDSQYLWCGLDIEFLKIIRTKFRFSHCLATVTRLETKGSIAIIYHHNKTHQWDLPFGVLMSMGPFSFIFNQAILLHATNPYQSVIFHFP